MSGSGKNEPRYGPRHRRVLSARESLIASIGLGAAAVVLLLVGSVAISSVAAHRRAAREMHLHDAQRAGGMLAEASAALLAHDELAAVQRMVTGAAQQNRFERCRITLPGDVVVAAETPDAVTVQTLPGTWPARPSAETDSAVASGGTFYPIDVPGRGMARLEIAVSDPPLAADTRLLILGLGLAGFGAMAAIVLSFHSVRRRVRGLQQIHEALLATGGDNRGLDALTVNDRIGPEATAWNDLIGRLDRLERERIGQKAGLLLASHNERRADLSRACDLMKQGMIIVDRDGTLAYLNGSAATYLGRSRQALSGVPIGEVFPPGELLDTFRATLDENRLSWTSVESRQGEGSQSGLLRFNVRGLGPDGGAMILISDITQQRIAETSRNAFVTQVTHELRMPLTNIALYVESAIDDGQLDAHTRKCLNIINQESRRLERIVGDMLSVAEIEAGTYELRRDDVRMDELLGSLNDDYAGAAREKAITLELQLPPKMPVVQADRDKISMALHNLVGNAIKYTQPDGQVTVRASADSERITVEVTDSGIGIDAAEIDRVFEKFYRARDKRITNVTGSGLGLALAREVMRMHGGDITVESVLDKGSTFRLVVPQLRKAA